jgi:cytochrome c2
LVARLAVLIGAALLAACLGAGPRTAATGCLACHEPHRERVAACVSCHRGNPAAARKELAHAHLLRGRTADHLLATSDAVRAGSRLVEAAGCRRCHVIGGSGNRLATELDAVAGGREQSEILSSILRPVENMPEFGFDPGQAEALAAVLLHHARDDGGPPPYRVHFQRKPAAHGVGFEETCGPCHRRLDRRGAQGSGSAGPNLSGLFTPHYPPTASGGRAWDARALREWLRNPRAVRGATTMPPVPMNEQEFGRLVEELTPR